MDPRPKARAILAKAATMSDKEFQQSLYEMIRALKDSHTVYYFPGKQSCFTFGTQIQFREIQSLAGPRQPRDVMIVGHLLQDRKVGFESGDILLEFDGYKLDALYHKMRPHLMDGNKFSGFSDMITKLSYRRGRYDFPPKNDNFTITFKSFKSGKILKETLPWITWRDPECMDQVARKASDLKTKWRKRSDDTRRELSSHIKKRATEVESILFCLM